MTEWNYTTPPLVRLGRAFAIGIFLIAVMVRTGLGAPSDSQPAAPRTSVAPDKLNESINEVVKQREYTWRFPRDKAKYALEHPDLDLSFFERIGKSIEMSFKKVTRWIEDFIGWLKFNPRARASTNGDGFNWGSAMKILILILIVALAVMIGILMFRLWKQRSARNAVASEALPAPPAPDVADESVEADQLPENEWIGLAGDLLRRGEYRLALRAYYLASLAHLADRNLITIARFKSNRDYEHELHRRGHALPGLADVFSGNVLQFERVWYGKHEITAEGVDRFASTLDRLKGDGLAT